MGASPQSEVRGTVDGLRVQTRCQCGAKPPLWLDIGGLSTLHAALGPGSSDPDPSVTFLHYRCTCGSMVGLSFRDLAVT